MINKDKHTNVVESGNGWIKLEHIDAWNVWLKTFDVDGKKVTVYLDDWSVSPISLHNYDLADLTIDSDWSSITKSTYFSHTEMDVAVLREYLPTDVYNEVESKYVELFAE